jgi:hypothetical protein
LIDRCLASALVNGSGKTRTTIACCTPTPRVLTYTSSDRSFRRLAVMLDVDIYSFGPHEEEEFEFVRVSKYGLRGKHG